MKKYKEQNRIRQQKYREKLKSEKEESNVTITLDNTQEENKIKNILNKTPKVPTKYTAGVL